MGRVYKRKGSDYWYVDYFAGGRRVRRCSGTTDKRAAGALMKKAETETRMRGEGFLDNRYPLEKLLEQFLAYQHEHIRPVSYRREVQALDRILPALGAKTAAEVTVGRATAYVAQRRAEGVAARTINIEVASLKHMLNRGVEWGLLRDSPIARVKPIKGPPTKERRSLSVEEEVRLLAAASPRYGDVFLALLRTGMRVGELVNLMWAGVDLERGLLCVRSREDWQTKTGENREIPIADELLPVLRRLREGEKGLQARVFLNRFGRPLDRHTTLQTFKKVVQQAGLPAPQELDLHALRVTFVSRLLERGANPKTVQALVGHRTFQMTMQVYARVLPGDRQRAIALLAPPSGASAQARAVANR